MEQTLSSHKSDQIEEKDITSVLEQLQENGFSSFFDHPDCPFSSIQEVDEALKELEKEFLKICVEQGAKSPEIKKKSKISVTASSASSNFKKYRPKSNKNDLKKESKRRLGTRERLDKKDNFVKKPENPKFGLPSTSRSASLCHPSTGRTKYANASECGDSKDVCGIDSCGNKYSLKIEVFATVKLEAEERNDAGNNVTGGSKTLTSRSKQKRSDNQLAFNNLVIPSKDQTDSCAPLVLNYRSSVCKPCPSYMYPTACDLRKNYLPQKRKVDALTRGVHVENKTDAEKFSTTNSNYAKPNEVIRQMSEKVCVEEAGGEADSHDNQIILRNELQHEVQYQKEDNYNFEKNLIVNYSAMKQLNESGLNITDPDKSNKEINNHSITVQTSLQDNLSVDSQMHLDVYNCHTDVLENLGLTTMFNQEQQTTSENTFPLRLEEKKVVQEIDVSESDPPKLLMVDKEVETSLFLLFDQNLINELKGLEQMIANNIINEDNYEQIILNDYNEKINNLCSVHRNIDSNYESIVNNDAIGEGSSLVGNICKERNRQDVLEEVEDDIVGVDKGIGTDLPESFALDYGQKDNVTFSPENSNEWEDDSYNYIYLNDDAKFDDNEVSESSSNETVIMKDSETDSQNTKETALNRDQNILYNGDFEGEPRTVVEGEDVVVGVSKVSVDGPLANLTLSQSIKYDLIDKAVGPSCVMLNYVEKRSNLVDKEVGMSKETLTNFSRSQKMSGKEVRATSIDSFFMELNHPATVDKDTGPEINRASINERAMVDKEIETVIQSKSMSTNMDEFGKKVSVKEMGTGVSKHSGVLKSKNDEPFSDKESSYEHSKFAKWSKAKVPMGQKLFKKSDSKSVESDKLKVVKERREKRKSEDGHVRSRDSATSKDKRKQEEDKDNTSSSTSSSGHLTRHDKENYRWREISEYETKFVKGVFSRHSYSSAAKNKIALRRRAFSNLDQKVIASKLAKSRKMIGSLKSTKKSSWERSKSHSGTKQMRKQHSKEMSTSSGEYRLPENTVINVAQ